MYHRVVTVVKLEVVTQLITFFLFCFQGDDTESRTCFISYWIVVVIVADNVGVVQYEYLMI